MNSASPSKQSQVQRQISLPMSKAVEIAYKSIRQRLSRSLLVTSGIVLALAFLMYIQVSDAMLGGLRNWMRTAPQSPQFLQLRQRAAQLEQQQDALAVALEKKVSSPAPSGIGKLDWKQRFGKDLAELQKELPPLPLAADTLTNRPDAADTLDQWMQTARQLRATRKEINGPQELTALMESSGVPTGEKEIADSKTQTRWLLGLALLVAFVGILNSMLMSVTERFREIGTMKCLGALDGFIIKLFLIESLFQGFVGTVIGVALGLLLGIAGAASSYNGFIWKMFPTSAIVWAFVFSLLVGVGLTVAGAVYPAWRAARMHPIEAMRVET